VHGERLDNSARSTASRLVNPDEEGFRKESSAFWSRQVSITAEASRHFVLAPLLSRF